MKKNRNNSKQMLFEMMHKVGGMPLKEEFKNKYSQFRHDDRTQEIIDKIGEIRNMLMDAGERLMSNNPEDVEYVTNEVIAGLNHLYNDLDKKEVQKLVIEFL